jgi:hypothetical protein
MRDIALTLAIGDVNLILEALGNLPFARVYALVGQIQEQAGPQITSANTAAANGAPSDRVPVGAAR